MTVLNLMDRPGHSLLSQSLIIMPKLISELFKSFFKAFPSEFCQSYDKVVTLIELSGL